MKIRIRTLLFCLLTSFSFLFSACVTTPSSSSEKDSSSGGGSSVEIGKVGTYTLVNKKVENFDVTNQYLFNCITLNSDGTAVWYETDYMGRSEKQATYTVEGSKVTLSIGVKDYVFEGGENGTLSLNRTIDRQNVQILYQYNEGYSVPEKTAVGVDFTDELFGEDKNENFYNYCPTAILEGNVMHVWYCSNKVSGNVTDYIAYRKGVLNENGKWKFVDKELVLEHGADGAWDSRHVCDPTVIKGKFAMKGEEYSYLMAFLGCKTSNNTYNEVGIAVAKSPEGPWIKADLNPIANYYESELFVSSTWGFGQPSLVSVNGAGRVLLFYASGAMKTQTIIEEWDLSNIDNAKLIRSNSLQERGVVNASGQNDCINNADFAYDPIRGRLYCIKEDFGYPTNGGVNWIAGSNTVMYIETSASFDELFSNESYTWSVCAKLTEGTGHARNHNACIVKNATGNLINPYKIPVLYTAAELATSYPDWNLGGQWPSLHTYRIHGINFDVL